MLVVAKDTTHAKICMKIIEDETFFGGRYKGKVIQVHSNRRAKRKTRPFSSCCRWRARTTRPRS